MMTMPMTAAVSSVSVTDCLGQKRLRSAWASLRLAFCQEGFDVCAWDAVGGIEAGWIELVGVGEFALLDPQGDELV